jgi:hypothetical protein
MRDGTGLCGCMNCGGVLRMMVKDRQEQTPFQVIDTGREVDSATDNSTTGFFDGVHGRHGPSWANLISELPRSPRYSAHGGTDESRQSGRLSDPAARRVDIERGSCGPLMINGARSVPHAPFYWVETDGDHGYAATSRLLNSRQVLHGPQLTCTRCHPMRAKAAC